MKTLEHMATEMKKNNQELICCLMFDEMSIRKHHQWCSKTKKFIGKVTYGPNQDETANNAIVFLVNGINAKVQVPVAYEFITALDGVYRMNMLRNVLGELHKRNVVIANITFDGLSANKTMCDLLGCDFESQEMKTHFTDPYSGREICVFFDPSHAIKLVRNNLYSRKELVDGDGNKIKWNHIKSLVEFGRKNDFNLTHKLTNRHINFQNKKMHVRTAVQTLSKSVADSLQFLKNQNVKGFTKVDPTCNMIRVFDRLFDIMNTQKVNHDHQNQFKSAVNFFNKEDVFAHLNYAKNYILKLKVQGQKSRRLVPIVSSLIKTGFRGFLINIHSLIFMYNDLVEQKEILYMIPVYRLSQDHIEMLFCKIRTVHRYNDNPTQQQFKASYKRIQLASDIPLSCGANISSSDILQVTSHKAPVECCEHTTEINHGFDDVTFDFDSLQAVENIENTESEEMKYSAAAISYVAFDIESRILKANGCIFCKRMLRENQKLEAENCVGENVPCNSTYSICKLTEKAISQLIDNANNNFNDAVVHFVMREIEFGDLYPIDFDSEHDEDHKHFLVRFVISEYIHLKCTFLSKQKNISMHNIYLRHKYRKEIHRAGQ